jgi:hypothetical protein
MERTWDRVTLLWDFGGRNIGGGGIATSVTPEGDFDPNACPPNSMSERNKVHVLGKMEAVSLPRSGGQRRGQIKLDIAGCFYKGSNQPPQEEAIIKFINQAMEKMIEDPLRKRKWGVNIEPPPARYHGWKKSWMDTEFVLSFVLADGEQFCDSVIELAEAIFEGLGIHDDHGFSLANFSIKRDTFVMMDGSWITFARWLRMSHRLPIYGPEDSIETIISNPTL